MQFVISVDQEEWGASCACFIAFVHEILEDRTSCFRHVMPGCVCQPHLVEGFNAFTHFTVRFGLHVMAEVVLDIQQSCNGRIRADIVRHLSHTPSVKVDRLVALAESVSNETGVCL